MPGMPGPVIFNMTDFLREKGWAIDFSNDAGDTGARDAEHNRFPPDATVAA